MKIATEFVKYGMAGGAAAATHLAVLSGLVQLLQVEKPLASAVGFCCAIPVNYYLQHRFVFRRSGGHRDYFVRYLAVTLTLLLLNLVLFQMLTVVFGIPYILAQILVIGLMFNINFLINRAFTFSDRHWRTAVARGEGTSGGTQ